MWALGEGHRWGSLVVPSAHPQSLGSSLQRLRLPQALSLRGLGDHTPWAPTLAKLFPESTELVDSIGSRGPMQVWGMQASALGHVFFLTI